MSYTNEFNSEGASIDQNLEKQIEESEDRLGELEQYIELECLILYY